MENEKRENSLWILGSIGIGIIVILITIFVIYFLIRNSIKKDIKPIIPPIIPIVPINPTGSFGPVSNIRYDYSPLNDQMLVRWDPITFIDGNQANKINYIYQFIFGNTPQDSGIANEPFIVIPNSILDRALIEPLIVLITPRIINIDNSTRSTGVPAKVDLGLVFPPIINSNVSEISEVSTGTFGIDLFFGSQFLYDKLFGKSPISLTPSPSSDLSFLTLINNAGQICQQPNSIIKAVFLQQILIPQNRGVAYIFRFNPVLPCSNWISPNIETNPNQFLSGKVTLQRQNVTIKVIDYKEKIISPIKLTNNNGNNNANNNNNNNFQPIISEIQPLPIQNIYNTLAQSCENQNVLFCQKEKNQVVSIFEFQDDNNFFFNK